MTHSSQPLTGPGARTQRLAVAALIVLTVGFGVWGYWEYEQAHNTEHPPDVASVFYHSLQLLIADGVHLDGHVPWQLQAGRVLGVTALFMAGMIAFTRFFRNEWLLWRLWAPGRSKHVLICGLGDLGLRLAIDLRRVEGKFVVALEKEDAAADIERARNSGVPVLVGDARDPNFLRKARINRAEFLVAAYPDDATNVAIAAAGRSAVAAGAADSPLVCRLLLRDPELRRLLKADTLLSHGDHQGADETA